MTTTEREAWVTDMRDRLRKCPNGQYAVQAGYMLAGFGQHRDSDARERTNWLEAQRILCDTANQEWYGDGDLTTFRQDGDDVYTDAVLVGSWRHWAVGWVEELLIRADRPDVVQKAFELHTYVTEQYPVLNDELLSALEAEDES